jgi:glycolate oxidase FAD binding subunit
MNDHAGKLAAIFGAMALKPADSAVWQARQQLHDMAGAFVLKLSTLPSDLCPLASELRASAAKRGYEIAVAAQAAGLATIALKATANDAIELVEHLRRRLKDKGGSVQVMQAPQHLHAAMDPWGYDANALPLMKEIKRRFDPNRILNPGRFVGNI